MDINCDTNIGINYDANIGINCDIAGSAGKTGVNCGVSGRSSAIFGGGREFPEMKNPLAGRAAALAQDRDASAFAQDAAFPAAQPGFMGDETGPERVFHAGVTSRTSSKASSLIKRGIEKAKRVFDKINNSSVHRQTNLDAFHDAFPGVCPEFKIFLDKADPGGPGYDGILRAVSLCGEALRSVRRGIVLSESVAENARALAEIEPFGALTGEEACYLEELRSRFASLSRERSQLLERLAAFDPSVPEMYGLESDAGLACPRIADAERSYRALRRDIAWLGGEKADLEHESEVLGRGTAALRWFAAGLASLFAAAAAALGYMGAYLRKEIFAPSAILAIFTALAWAMLSGVRKRTARELSLNAKKRRKAVGLLNKKSVLYAYYANYLDFSYKKYRVRSSGMLKENLDGLTRHKRAAAEADAVRKLMYETREEIERFLREKGLGGLRSAVWDFDGSLDAEDKRRRCGELRAALAKAESELALIDGRRAEIWELLTELDAADASPGRVVAKVMERYAEAAGGATAGHEQRRA